MQQLAAVLERGRWFFVRLSGWRRIGKTTLIQQALRGGRRRVLYMQVPDSGPAGVLSAVRDAFETFAKFIARNPGCTNGELDAHVREVSPETVEQTAGYVKILSDKYELVERRLPIFAKKKGTKRPLLHSRQLSWDSQGTEIDLVAVDDANGRIRFGSCKRAPSRLEASIQSTERHIARFLEQLPKYQRYSLEKVALAPEVDPGLAARIRKRGWLVEDLRTLTDGL